MAACRSSGRSLDRAMTIPMTMTASLSISTTQHTSATVALPDCHCTEGSSSMSHSATQPPQASAATSAVLVVDLDNSLITTDLLYEGLFRLIKAKPWFLLIVPFWLLGGKAGLKSKLADAVSIQPDELPYNEALLEVIRAERAQGVPIVLATASHQDWAQSIADHLGLFDAVLGSTPERNLKGRAKLEAIQAYCRDRGLDSFAYVGDCDADLPIWEAAHEAYVVAPSRALLRRLEAVHDRVRPVGQSSDRLRAAIRALRPHQWAKNVLIFIPLILSQQFLIAAKLVPALLAFASFSLAASAIYLVNDLLDLGSDRKHEVKRKRPFASGALPLAWGPPMTLALLTASLILALFGLPTTFSVILVIYLFLTTAYSFYLKSRLMADVLLLASLYTIRIFAGGAAIGTGVTEWLTAFSMFFFLSLAFVKRYVELDRSIVKAESDEAEGRPAKISGRGYYPGDISLIESIGPTCGYLSVLIMALYVQSPQVQPYYNNVMLLYLLCPILLYWLSRIWFLAKRRQMPGDPVVFAIKDRSSQLIGVLAASILIAGAKLPPFDIGIIATEPSGPVANEAETPSNPEALAEDGAEPDTP